jgi:hypothetical protein
MANSTPRSELLRAAPATPAERDARFDQARAALAVVAPHLSGPRPKVVGFDVHLVFSTLDLYVFHGRFAAALGDRVRVFGWRTRDVHLPRDSWLEHREIGHGVSALEIVVDEKALWGAFDGPSPTRTFDGRPARDATDAILQAVAHRMVEAVQFMGFDDRWRPRETAALASFVPGELGGFVCEFHDAQR